MARALGPDLWKRTPNLPFDDLAREQYAQARAKGLTVRKAAEESGVVRQTATKFEAHPAMALRIRELRQSTQAFVDVSVAWIIGQLKTNAELAREEGQLKSSNEALKLIYEIVKTDPTVANNMARQLPPTTSTRVIRKHLLESLTGAPTHDVEVEAEVTPEDAHEDEAQEDEDDAAE